MEFPVSDVHYMYFFRGVYLKLKGGVSLLIQIRTPVSEEITRSSCMFPKRYFGSLFIVPQ